MWQGLLAPSLERLSLSEHQGGFELSGLVLQAHETGGYVADYRILLDTSWATSEITLRLDGSSTASLTLHRSSAGGWLRNGDLLTELTGISDIDLEWSPSTNTLPIRRLQLRPGTSATVVAAWVRFPSLTIERLEQSYERVDDCHYRYRSSDFVADLEVDADGLVRTYGRNWRMVASSGWS